MWVLTREINEYDQDGEYFVSCWNFKPNAQEMSVIFPGITYEFWTHISNGGGRKDIEETWYNLREYEEGEKYETGS